MTTYNNQLWLKVNLHINSAHFKGAPSFMEDMHEEDSLLQLPLYHCQACRAPANHPVLPPCGHLHWYLFLQLSWKCLHLHNTCTYCQASFEPDDLFSLFVDHGELEAEGLPLPPKPKPRYSGRIRNSGTLSESAGLRYQDNMSQGVPLAGYGYFPPLLVASMVCFGLTEGSAEEESLEL